MSWLQQHIETFVAPHLVIPDEEEPRLYSSHYAKMLQPERMSVIKNVWRSAKSASRGRKILLMGRDVWVFEVLAQRENFPTIFDPSCSRQTCYHPKFAVYNRREHILLDTGFVGSIAKALKVDCILLSADRFGEVAEKQIFPRLKGARSLALFLESLPKYWTSGILVDREVYQTLNDQYEFRRAALLTQEVYTDSSPRFVTSRNPLGAMRYE